MRLRTRRSAVALAVMAVMPVTADAQRRAESCPRALAGDVRDLTAVREHSDEACAVDAADAVGGTAAVDAAVRAARAAGSAWRPLSVLKWTALTASVGGGAYGLWAQHEADRGYERVARICADEPERCGGGPAAAGGDYADRAVGRLRDRASTLEDRALLSLIGSQIGLITSVLLFILDMRESGTPPNEIYRPGSVHVVPRGRAGAALRVRLATPW